MQRIFNFSGGATSGYMTIKYYQPGDLVLFADTGREHPKTYKFIADFEAHEGIEVIKVGTTTNGITPFDALLASKQYRVIPNRVKRICTDMLKIRVIKRHLRSVGIRTFENFIGFRYDEQQRVLRRKQHFKNVIDHFPLYEDKIEKHHIDAYWKQKPYRLEIPRILGNCTLCFMKGQAAIITILSQYPELAEPWINDEDMSEKLNGRGNGRTYFNGITIRQLRDYAQNSLFKDYKLDDVLPQYNCECSGI